MKLPPTSLGFEMLRNSSRRWRRSVLSMENDWMTEMVQRGDKVIESVLKKKTDQKSLELAH